jgi:tRNA pseudouridine38-40 synthase
LSTSNRYKLTIAYDGAAYCGWQVQANGISIQSLVQKALQTVLREPVDCTGSGRTDAGVHALGQTAHFDGPENLKISRTKHSLNALLPSDIRIFNIEPVHSDFHARYSAVSKTYHYHLHLDPISNPFVHRYRHHVRGPCNLSRILDAVPYFLGKHDFFSFANKGLSGSASRDSIRTLSRIDLVEQKGGVRLEFEGDGFLYKMVRNITGTLLDVGSGVLSPSDIPAIFEAKDRRKARFTAPPQGLFLMEVRYKT